MNNDFDLYTKARKLALKRHMYQTDKCGVPYYSHCEAVANSILDKMIEQNKVDYVVIAIAWMHDLLEDTETAYDELVENFGQSVADHVNMLTRREDMSYMDYINSLKHNDVCRKVKIADLLHNMDLTRLNKITKKDIERNRKYLKALEVLIEMEG